MVGSDSAPERPVAVIADPDELDPSPAVRLLEEAGFEVAVLNSRDRERVRQGARHATALVVGYAALDAELFGELERLRIVATMSVGFDTIDLEAAKGRGVWVSNVPDAATEEVAVHAFALCLSIVRRVTFLDRHVRAGGWAIDAHEEMRRPSRLTLGIVGLGRIGRELARLAAPCFGRLVGHDPYVDGASWPAGVERCGTLEDLLRRSDVVSLHMPGEQNGAALLDAARLALLPPGAALINVSRGSLVDTAALLTALDDGHLSGAGLDVVPTEPPAPDDPVRSHPRVVLTPHFAYSSDESARLYVLRAAENVIEWARTGRPRNVVAEGSPEPPAPFATPARA